MTVAALDAAGRIELARRPRPEPGPGEVRLRVEACGLCGSDLHFWRGGPMCPGVAPGHEIAGCVEALGDGVEGWRVGDRAAVEPLASCGECHACRSGRDALCPRLAIFGVHRDGGFAESVAVPAHRLFRVPDDLPPAVAALAEPLAVGVHGLRLGRLAPGQRVLVLGAGSIGLLAARAARALGAGEVWISARHPQQAERARALGATRVLTEAEAAPAALAGTAGGAPVDLVVETVGGRADTLAAATAAVRPGGVISVLGLFTGAVRLEPLALFLKEATLVWPNCYGRGPEGADFARAVALVDALRAELEPLVTHRVPLAEARRAYELAGDKASGAVKVCVTR
jgi:2-desacetyl-2-hydroxyethyl bacteriochlorophyllide A dehydrogenase